MGGRGKEGEKKNEEFILFFSIVLVCVWNAEKSERSYLLSLVYLLRAFAVNVIVRMGKNTLFSMCQAGLTSTNFCSIPRTW